MGLLAAVGGIGGIVLGWMGLRLFDAVGAHMMPRWESVRIDGGVIAYVVLLLVVTSLITGIVPALSQRTQLFQDLKAAGRSGDLSGAKRLRIGLVVAEIALTLGLVTSAGLVVRSFETLTHVGLGFDPRHLYTIEIPSMPKAAYPNYDAELNAANRLVAAVRNVPGVLDAAATTVVPFKGGFIVGTTIPGRAGSHEADVDGNSVAAGYFRVMHIPLLRGRDFTARDGPHAQSVAIVNAAFARQFFGTLDVVGRRIRPGVSSGNTPSMIRTIVGVVVDTRNGFSKTMRPQFYLPITQLQALGLIVARTNGHDAGFAQAVERAYASVDPAFPAPEVVSYDMLFAQDAGRWRAAAMLFSALAVLALLLALAGIYAVSAYAVQQRTQEFGIRKAIGARDSTVLGGVIVDALGFAAIGIVIGTILAAVCTRYLSSLLFQTSPLDPLTFGVVAALIVACTVLAALVPALRATRIHPASALRYE
jgi:putative ABC transport system permease protein